MKYIITYQQKRCWYTKLLVKLHLKSNDVLNIVAIPRELQPHREEFGDTFKFVGPCVSDDIRNFEFEKDNELQSVLELFQINQNGKKVQQDLKLIYVSIGTVFLSNTFIFEHIFEALSVYDSSPRRKFKSAQFRVIVSVGKSGLRVFEEKMAKGELTLPSNVLLKAKVPQIEVLKRADLFITHCGMNSTTETIKYGVPIVAIPIDADQPKNARRVCDELEFGIRLDALKLNTETTADAIDRVMSEEKYRVNIEKMSIDVQKYNGAVEGAKLIKDYLIA